MADDWGGDVITADARLCDDDGWVRGGPMHHGEHYTCTGHAHFAGEHYRCTSPAHAPGNMPLPDGGWGPRRPDMVVVERPHPGPYQGTVMSLDVFDALEQLGVKPGQFFVITRGGS